jgi:hypothetical protein
MAPRTGTRSTHVPNRLPYVQRTPLDLKRRADEIAGRMGISTNALINQLLEELVARDEARELQDA